MTLRSRKKRQTTAPALAEVKRTNCWASSALRVLIAASMLASQADAAVLKWRPYRAPEIRPESADEVSQPVRSRLRSAQAAERSEIRQVGNQSSSAENPFADPFEDDNKPVKKAAAQAVERVAPVIDEGPEDRFPEPVKPTDDSEPSKLSPTDDFFPEESVPDTLERETLKPPAIEQEPAPILDSPSPSDESPSYDYYNPTVSDCQSEKADCADALAKLKSNTLANIDLSIGIGGVEGQDFPCECGFGMGETFEGRNWTCVTYNWKASGLCHKPLYFEQVAVERYGHSAPTLVQDVLCGAHFFASIPALPYMMGLCPPGECQYSLGYYRPGNCAPYLIDPIPLSLRAGLFQAGAIVGGILIIP